MKLARLRTAIGRDARTIAISAAVASVVTATPAVAAIVANSDKVDGKHAVGAKAKAEARAGKLVATDKRGRLPDDILGQAMDADRLDGMDSGQLRIVADGLGAETNPIVHGCGETVVLSQPLTVEDRAQVFATGATALAVTSDKLHPAIQVQLLDGEDVVAWTSEDSWSGRDGDDLATAGLLLDDTTTGPYVAKPGTYTLRILGNNSGLCDQSTFAQYQEARLSHLQLPVVPD